LKSKQRKSVIGLWPTTEEARLIGRKENLHEFAQRVSKLPPGSYTFREDMEKKQKKNVCLFCNKQLEMYESKAGNRYLANADHSPHRKVYKCCNSWGEYNGN